LRDCANRANRYAILRAGQGQYASRERELTMNGYLCVCTRCKETRYGFLYWNSRGWYFLCNICAKVPE
jgi:hypothetical protein